MERSLPVRNVAAVHNGGDLIGESLLGERVGLGVDLGRVGELGQSRDESGQSGVIAYSDSVVYRTVSVILRFNSRKRRRVGRRRLCHISLKTLKNIKKSVCVIKSSAYGIDVCFKMEGRKGKIINSGRGEGLY